MELGWDDMGISSFYANIHSSGRCVLITSQCARVQNANIVNIGFPSSFNKLWPVVASLQNWSPAPVTLASWPSCPCESPPAGKRADLCNQHHNVEW